MQSAFEMSANYTDGVIKMIFDFMQPAPGEVVVSMIGVSERQVFVSERQVFVSERQVFVGELLCLFTDPGPGIPAS